ncbi:non-ribosomal peptide synthetase/MFS transporter [Streptomyces sp. NBC_01217]|uniref:non-ribosomal peptide synthetase/MFS transporter n=1 Tax=Streptomyces sp. NBC_01217 TaxID=2903779 RepID=UPI002E167489|nr:non-ribosomal peptide synthetase [Streptomyces sp. NBC_01217]WSQ55737.1 amino acid adenylation domain-containing protein [Streptomyces sp. NBC_01217]
MGAGALGEGSLVIAGDAQTRSRELLERRLAAALAKPADTLPRRSDPSAPVPLTSAQSRLWFLDQLGTSGSAFHSRVVLRLRGSLDEQALLAAVRELAQRHEVLRSRIEERDGEPVTVVGSAADVPVIVEDVPVEHLDAALAAEAGRPFDLARRPPMRAALLRNEDVSVLALTFHHIAIDGTSLGVIRAELPALYAARLGLAEALPLPEQHTDYAAWQASHPEQHDDLDWWEEQLAGLAPQLDLPADRPRPAVAGPAGSEVDLVIAGDRAERVREVAVRTGCTPFMVFLATWQALLSRMCGTTDVPVGVVEAGRRHPSTDNMVGCFINTVVMRTDLSGDPTWAELLQRTRELALDAFAHADVPFERVVSRLRPDRSATSAPIVQTLFNFLVLGDEPPAFPGLEVTALSPPVLSAKSDLHLTVAEGPAGFTGNVNYRSDLFDEETVRDIALWYQNLLAQMLNDLEAPVGAAALAPTAYAALRGPVREETPRTLHPLVERWADRTPDALAVVAPDGRLTYGALDRTANRIAHALIAAGVTCDEPVGVLLEHSVALPAALHGVLKAGAGYVPLDAMYPASRITSILETAGVRTVVTVREFAGLFKGDGRHVVVLDDPATLRDRPEHRPDVPVRPEHLLHVIFTSGSTGTPKGVAVEHGSVTDYLDGVLERLGEDVHGGVFAVMSTIAADFAHTCFHAALTTGGTLHFVARETAMDPVALAGYLADHPMDVIKLVPSHFELLAAHGDIGAVLPRKLLMFAGEALPWSIVERARAARPGLRVQNHYGHTESTMVRMVCDVDDVPDGLRTGIVPLGRPVPNTTGFLADREGRPLPAGIPGEFLVGGPGVARGYIGAPELTAQRFVTVDGRRLYRSGDVLRMRPDGWVEFRGRVDDQVKVRGYRVEPGDVAEALRGLPGVAEAVVLPVGEGQRQGLAGWVVQDPGSSLDSREVRTGLRERLPEYMVPASLTVLDRFPLTPNGKVDRAALPRPSSGDADERVPPRTPTEHRLAGVWAQVLGLPRIGIDDDFFALGGDSFAAVRAVRACDPGLRVIDMFTRPTVRELAAHLDAADTGRGRLLHRLSGSRNAAATVVCVPYGGGSAAVYQPLAAALPDDLALLAVELPGHDPARPAEEFWPLDELTERLAEEIEATVGGPVLVYGHSVGSAAAVALARRLEAGGREVLGVVVAGNFPSAGLPGRLAAWANRVLPLERWASSRHYRDVLRTTGGILDDMDDTTTETALRAMRHDSTQARAWYARELAAPRAALAAPVLCVVGEADHSTELYQERYREWGAFADRVELATIPKAGHYFLRHQAAPLAALLRQRITDWTAGRLPEPVAATPVRSSGLRPFHTVAAGQFLSMLGGSLSMFALGVWAYQRSGRVLDLALVTMLATLPAVLVTPLGGTVADRVDRRRVMLAADGTSGLAMAVLAVLLATGRMSLAAVCLIVTITSIATAFHRPAYLAATAQLVPKPYLPQANALVGLGLGFAGVVGPLLGGALVAVVGVSGVVGVSVCAFAAGVGSLLAVRFPDRMFRRQRETFGQALTGGWRFIARRRPLLLLTGFAAVLNLFASTVFVAVQPLVLSFAGTAQLGLVTTVGGLGGVVGGLLMVPWGGTRRRAIGMIGATLGVGAGTVLMGVHASLPVVAAGLALRIGAMAVMNAHWLSIIQVKVGQELQGRVLATNVMLALATQPVGFLAAGPLADGVFTPALRGHPALGAVLGTGPGSGMALLLIVCGLCIAAWGALGLLYRPLRRLEDDLPDATPGAETEHDLDLVQEQADTRFAATRRTG